MFLINFIILSFFMHTRQAFHEYTFSFHSAQCVILPCGLRADSVAFSSLSHKWKFNIRFFVLCFFFHFCHTIDVGEFSRSRFEYGIASCQRNHSRELARRRLRIMYNVWLYSAQLEIFDLLQQSQIVSLIGLYFWSSEFRADDKNEEWMNGERRNQFRNAET